MRGGRGFLLGTLLCVLMGCMAPERAVVTDLDPAGWRGVATVDYRNEDTLSMRALRLFLRLEESFREDTLTLRVATQTPDSLVTIEYHRLVVPMHAAPASIQRVVEIPYRRNVQLTRVGRYRFLLTPVRMVQGVEAVGMKITNE